MAASRQRRFYGGTGSHAPIRRSGPCVPESQWLHCAVFVYSLSLAFYGADTEFKFVLKNNQYIPGIQSVLERQLYCKQYLAKLFSKSDIVKLQT